MAPAGTASTPGESRERDRIVGTLRQILSSGLEGRDERSEHLSFVTTEDFARRLARAVKTLWTELEGLPDAIRRLVVARYINTIMKIAEATSYHVREVGEEAEQTLARGGDGNSTRGLLPEHVRESLRRAAEQVDNEDAKLLLKMLADEIFVADHCTCSGKPRFSKTRIPVILIAKLLKSGADINEILSLYDSSLTREEVELLRRALERGLPLAVLYDLSDRSVKCYDEQQSTTR